MQPFSVGAWVQECQLIMANMLDLQNLRELGKGCRRERYFSFSPSLPPCFFFQPIPTPLVALLTLPNLPLLLKSKMAAKVFACPQKVRHHCRLHIAQKISKAENVKKKTFTTAAIIWGNKNKPAATQSPLDDQVERKFPRGITNQKHYLDLGSDASSVWNFYACYSDVVLQGLKWWSCETSAVFSGYRNWSLPRFTFCKPISPFANPFFSFELGFCGE